MKQHAPCLPQALALLSYWLGGSACVPPQPEPQLPQPLVVRAGVPAALLDPGQLAWQPGLHEYELQVVGQGSRSAEIWMPATAPRALVIMLHGTVVPRPQGPPRHSTSGGSGLVGCLAEPALHSLDPIIVAPRSVDGQWWHESDTGFVLGLVRAVRQRWPEAGARSVIAGYSNGGIATWYFARLYPEYFTAAVPMAFSFDIVGASALPIYAIQGTRDEQFEIEPVRAAIQMLKAQGQDVTLKERFRGSHHQMCAYVPELAQAGEWLEQHVFSALRPGG
jgi:poly(3-hydroxybutyrate) depolymerase